MDRSPTDAAPLAVGPRASAGGPRVVFAGMRGSFSRIALAGLLAAGADVRGVLVAAEAGDAPPAGGAKATDRGAEPGGVPAIWTEAPRAVPRSTLPLLTSHREASIMTLGWERGIPVLAVGRERDPNVRARLAALAPDVVCVACWPRRVPTALLDLARYGWLNLHPSPLPAHRGPAPLFWTFRAGESETGVTVHRMDATLDGGEILAQEPIAVPDGIAGDVLEDRCAEIGGRLLARVLRDLAAGTVRPCLAGSGAGSYEPMPGPDDFNVTPDRSARWAFNFIRGAAYWGGPIAIVVAGRRFAVAEALDYIPGAASGEADRWEEPYRVDGRELWLRCAPGILRVRLAE